MGRADPINLRRLAARAIAELTVIVLGVWIALWADSWATTRNQRSIEYSRLSALQANVDTTLSALRTFDTETQQVMQSIRRLLAFQDARGTDSVLAEVRDGFLSVPYFVPSFNVYDDLKNAGELSTLTDAYLRQSLSTMEARLLRLSTAQSDMTIVQQLNVDRYLVAHVDLALLLSGELGLGTMQPKRGSADMRFVLEREFRNLAVLRLDVLNNLIHASAQLEPTLLDVQQSIARQLDERRE